MFHVERYIKGEIVKLFLAIVLIIFAATSCRAPRPTVQISEYTLLRGGREVLGNKDGLVAFVFENNQRKIPFVQFISNKYKLGTFTEVEYFVTIDNIKFKVYVYDNAELEKYFDTSAFTISNVEPEMSIVGSKANFLAVSVIDAFNEDALADGSLYQNIVLEYLKELRKEYYNS